MGVTTSSSAIAGTLKDEELTPGGEGGKGGGRREKNYFVTVPSMITVPSMVTVPLMVTVPSTVTVPSMVTVPPTDKLIIYKDTELEG